MGTSLAGRISGTFTALVTPFADDDARSIDWGAFDALIDAQIASGVSGLVPCGTTGEAPTLSDDEKIEVVRRTVDRAKKRVFVLAGTGTNSTATSVTASRAAEKAGADGVMLVVPYYSKPTQEGLARHFVTVAKSVKCPVVLYNIPARSGVDLLPETIGRIVADAPNVVAIKEATGNVVRAQELVRIFGDRLVVMSGDDALTLPMIAVGARGVISVTSNVLPAEVAKATRLALEGEMTAARKAHLALLPIHQAMFVEANPAPAKAALALLGVTKDAVRGPLAPCTESARATVKKALDALEIEKSLGRPRTRHAALDNA